MRSSTRRDAVLGDAGQPRRDAWPDLLASTESPPVAVAVAVVDADPAARARAIRRLLQDPRTDVVCQCSGYRDASRRLSAWAFDVLLVDAELPDGDGLGLISAVRLLRPSVESVLLTRAPSPYQARAALSVGAFGYLPKDHNLDALPDAIFQVASGAVPVMPAILRELLVASLQIPEAAAAPLPLEALSPRERAVLAGLADGDTSAQIGEALRISTATVNTHVRHIYSKLNVNRRAQLIKAAARHERFAAHGQPPAERAGRQD